MYLCPFCAGFLGRSFKKLLGHIQFIHSHETNLSITCGDCGQSFRKFSSFKSHINREQEKKTIAERAVLGDDVVENEDNATLSDDEHDCDEQEEAKDYVRDVTRFLALFLLKTKEELTNQLTQQTINAILGNTEDVVETSMQCLKDKIITCLTNNDMNIADVAGLKEKVCTYQKSNTTI